MVERVRADERSLATSAGGAAAFILLENNTAMVLDRTGAVLRRMRLGRPVRRVVAGRFLAIAPGRELRVVVPGERRDSLAFVTSDGRELRRVELPSGVQYVAIEAGRSTGRLYLAGEISTGRQTAFGNRARKAVLTVLSPDGKPVSTVVLREPAPGRFGPSDWWVHDIAVAPDEARIFVSYHGANTGGADGVTFTGERLVRCASGVPGKACIQSVHGSVQADEHGIVASLGTPPQLARFTWNGRRTRVWGIGLRDGHLMEFAVNGTRAFTIGDCAKTGGMTVVDLRSGQTRVLHSPAPVIQLRGLPEPAICGERISVGRGSLIAVMKRGTITNIAGALLLDSRGRVVRWLRLRPAPIDVVALP